MRLNVKKYRKYYKLFEIHFDEFILIQKRFADFILYNSDEGPYFTADNL